MQILQTASKISLKFAHEPNLKFDAYRRLKKPLPQKLAKRQILNPQRPKNKP